MEKAATNRCGFGLNKAVWLLQFILLGLLCAPAWAADLPGGKDHPLLKRFAGSEIVGYDAKRFDTYELQTSTYTDYDFEAKRREFAEAPLKLEGAVTRIWYEARGEASAVELLRNYQNELKDKGFQILYDSTGDDNATTFNSSFFKDMDSVKTSRSDYVFTAANMDSVCVSSAKLERAEGDVYVRLAAVEWPDKDDVFKAKRGAYIAVDIIEVRPMKQNMVVVSADEMSQALSSSGRIALYGIFFDTNKADIKPESKPALEEIAKLLTEEPDLKLHVVGHTDNVGGYEANLSLSKRRADAVVAALVKDYGISAGRLTSNGVAYLAPLTVNTTEEGRAKNRRVELVPQ